MAVRRERRDEAPDRVPEIDREITMIQGALQGIEQRVGELAAALHPVLDPKTWAALTHGDIERMAVSDELAPTTEYGERLRRIQYEISALEATLSYLSQGVRT